MSMIVVIPQVAAPTPALAATAPISAAPDLWSAQQAAKSQGSQVEVTSLKTADSQTWVKPDGSLVSEITAAPVRVRRADGGWDDVDLTLASSNGVVAPRVPLVPFVATGGGSSTLVSEALAGGTVQVSWDSPLPTPVLSGTTATYPDVRPGVDLVVESLRSGLEVSFVVKAKPAAGLVLPLTVGVKGLSSLAQADGSVKLTDSKGQVVGQGGTPVMFGSPVVPGTTLPSAAQTVAAAISSSKTASLAALPVPAGWSRVIPGGTGTASTWTMTPDPAFFSRSDVVYPVKVDPTLTTYANPDTYINQTSPTLRNDTATRMYIGTNNISTGNVKRSFVQFARPTVLQGMYLSTASLRLFNSYSATCTVNSNARVDLYALTTAVNPAWSWNTRPTSVWTGAPMGTGDYRVGTNTFVHNGNACLGSAYDTIPIDNRVIAAWANGSLSPSLQISAVENVVNGYKEFYTAEAGSGTPALVVGYWAYPTASTPTATGMVASLTGGYYVHSSSVTLNSSVSSSTGNAVVARFRVTNTANGAYTDYNGTSMPGSGNSQVTLTLGDGRYVITAAGQTGGIYGAESGGQTLTVDTSPPPAPALTNSAFGNGEWKTSYAGATTFTASAGGTDVQDFVYSYDNGPGYVVAASGGSATLPAWTPSSGAHQLLVWTRNSLGWWSNPTAFNLGVGAPSVSTVSQTQVATVVPVSAVGPAGSTGASLQYRTSAFGWQTIAAGDASVTEAGTATAWTGRVVGAPAGSGTPNLVWRIPTSTSASDPVSATNLPAPLSIDVRVCLHYNGPDSCSNPITVQRVPHDTSSTKQAGPGSVSLSTGEFTYSAIDSQAPGFTGTLGVDRTLLSLDAPGGSAGHSFGPGWTSSLSDPAGGDLQATVVDHTTSGTGLDNNTLVLTYPDGTADTYTTTDTSGDRTFTYTGQGDGDTSGTRLILNANNLDLDVIDPDGTRTRFHRAAVASPFAAQTVTEPQAASGGQGSTTTVLSGADTSTLPSVPGLSANDSWRATVQGAPGISCGTSIAALPAGCRAVTVVYAAPGTSVPTGSATGPYPGQVRLELYRAYNPAKSGGAGMDTVVTAVFAYDAQGRLRSSYDPRADVTAGTHLVTSYDYDSSNRLTALTPPGLAQWRMTYDASGKLTAVTRDDLAGTTATTTYVYGVPLTGTGLPDMSPGSVATWGQPSSGAPSTVVAVFPPTHPVSGAPSGADWPYAGITYLDTVGRTVNTASYGAGAWQIDTTVRDDKGRTSWTLTAGNRAMALSSTCQTGEPSDVCGQPTTVSRALLLASWTQYSATDASLVTDTFSPAHTVTRADGSTLTQRTHTATAYVADTDGPAQVLTDQKLAHFRLVDTTTESGYTLDPGNPTSLTSGTTTDPRVTKHGYDPIDGASRAGATSGWVLGQPTSVTTDPGGLAITTRTLFDAAGRVFQTRQPRSDGTDQGTRITTYYTTAANSTVPACGAHPEWDGLVCQVEYAGTGAAVPVTRTTSYSMILAPTTVTDTLGTTLRTTTTNYDTAGRVTGTSISTTNAPPGTAPVPDTTTTYWPATGLLKSVTSTAGTLTTTYDTFGRVTTQTDGSGGTATTAYDAASRPISVTNDKGTTTYGYDTSTEHRGLVTALDPGIGGGLPSAFTAISYDASGHLTSFTFPNGVTASDSYDTVGAPTTRSYTAAGAASPFLSWSRGYSAHGQVVLETGPSSAGARTQLPGYDAAGRLASNADTIGSVCTIRAYGFDTDSDRTSASTWAGASGAGCPAATAGTESRKDSAVFNAFGQRTTSTATGSGAGSGSYSYDAMGRATALPAVDAPTAAGGAVTLTYFANDLPATQTQGATTRTYGLDPLGRLATWTDTTTGTSSTTNQHYDTSGDSPAWTDTGNGAWTRQVSSPAGLLGLTVTGNATGPTNAQIALTDPHGDVVATIPDTANATPASMSGISDYDEYGQLLTGPGPVAGYGWTGGQQRMTSTTGLIQMGVRLYNTATGAFLAPDPVYGGNTTPYTYPNDPLTDSDLSGKCPWCAGVLAFGVAMDWNPIGWVVTGVVVVAGAAYVGYQGYEAWERSNDDGRAEMGKRPARNADRDGHRTTKNGRSQTPKHEKAQGHGGREKPNFKPNPNKRRS